MEAGLHYSNFRETWATPQKSFNKNFESAGSTATFPFLFSSSIHSDMSPAPLHSPTLGTPAAPPVADDCKSGVLGFFHTIERLKVDLASLSPLGSRGDWLQFVFCRPTNVLDGSTKVSTSLTRLMITSIVKQATIYLSRLSPLSKLTRLCIRSTGWLWCVWRSPRLVNWISQSQFSLSLLFLSSLCLLSTTNWNGIHSLDA